MITYISYILLLIAGGCIGVSAGLGFWPVYKQPKNIIRQVSIGLIGAVAAGLGFIMLI